LLATNDVLYADHGQRDLQDVMTCIREGVRLTEAGRLLDINAERHIKSTAEMLRLFADAPDAVAETRNFLDRIDFSLDQLVYEYPEEPVPPGGGHRRGLSNSSGVAPKSAILMACRRKSSARFPTNSR
jgi:error-prone DNA polymerase